MKSSYIVNLNTLKKYCVKVIVWLMELNYYSAKGFYKYMLNRSHQRYKGSPLLIYQMGKVGSSTVQASLRSLKLDMPIYHTHILTKERISETE